MASKKSLEDYLDYHGFQAWKKVKEGVKDVHIEAYLAHKDEAKIASDILTRPDELRDAIFKQVALEEASFPTEKKGDDSHSSTQDGSSTEREPASLRLFIYIAGWPILFGIWLATEPYGRRMSYGETEEALAIFCGGLFVWVLGSFIFSKLHPHRRMLSTPFKLKARGFFTERMKNEINEYITLLKSADDDEVGLALLAAVDFRNQYLAETGIDLFEPRLALFADDNLSFKFARQIEESQAENGILAVPLLVWAHTLRATQNPMVRDLGREMWGELLRGLDHVDEKIESFQFVIGRTPDLTGMGKVPDGLLPRNQPKEPKSSRNLSHSEQEAELLHLKSMFDKNLITKDVYEQRQRDILG